MIFCTNNRDIFPGISININLFGGKRCLRARVAKSSKTDYRREGLTGARILVVDDEKAIRDGLYNILQSEGYEVDLSDSGYSALEMLQAKDFQAVITDLKMPGMDGMEVLKAITILQPSVPVIFITGYSTLDNAVEVMKMGAFDFMSKPVNRTRLDPAKGPEGP